MSFTFFKCFTFVLIAIATQRLFENTLPEGE